MANELISMNYIEDRLTAQDDPALWKEVLAVLGEEFLQRYHAERGERNRGSSGLERVRIGCGRTKAAGLRQASSPCPSDTRVQLAGRTTA